MPAWRNEGGAVACRVQLGNTRRLVQCATTVKRANTLTRGQAACISCTPGRYLEEEGVKNETKDEEVCKACEVVSIP